MLRVLHQKSNSITYCACMQSLESVAVRVVIVLCLPADIVLICAKPKAGDVGSSCVVKRVLGA